MRYRADIDGLRAVAVLAVVLYHLGVPPLSGGFVGVDIFFVISGFLITGIIVRERQAGQFSLASFYARRLRRIAPALLAVCAASALVALLFFAPVHLRPFGASLLAAVTSTSNILFWRENGYFDVSNELRPLLNTWSLGVEEQFYLIWPAVLLMLGLQRRFGFMACGIIALAGFASAEFCLRTDPSAAFYLLPFRVGELAIGASLVWLPQNLRLPRRLSGAAFLAAGATLIWVINTFNARTPFPGFSAVVPCLATAVIIACRPRGRLRWLLENAATIQVGRISYSLYLVHWPVIVFWQYYRFTPLTGPDQLGAGTLSLALGLALFLFVERPFRARSSGAWIVLTRNLVAASAGVAIPLCLFAAVLWSGWSPYSQGFDGGPLQARADAFEAHGPKIVDLQKADVLLIGDSHADHYTEATLQATNQAGLSLARSIRAGCPPLLAPQIVRPKAVLDNDMLACLEQVEAWKREIRSFNGSTVVLASRWSLMTEPSHYGRHRVRRHWLLIDPDNPNDLEGPRDRFERALKQTVAFITSEGKRVVILGQVPETGIDLNACYAAPTLILPPPYERCIGEPSDEMLRRLAFDNRLLLTIMGEHPGDVMAFIASDALCPEGVCEVSVDATLLYRNEDHLTPAGSLFLADRMNAVRDFLRQ